MPDAARRGNLVPVALVALATALPTAGWPASDDAAALERDCRAGHAAACDALARMHDEGRGVPRDAARGLELHEKACEGGHLESCRSAGVLLERTPGITPDPARARSFFEKACDGGNAAACGNLAVQVESQDNDRALALYVRACDMGNVLACSNGAHFLTWAKSDPRQRITLLEKGCAFGGGSMAAMACTTLAREHEAPGASAEDAAEAAKLRERSVRILQEACDGNGWECRGLAAMYESGDGVPRDPERAVTLWKRYAAEVQRASEHDQNPWLLGELAQLHTDGKAVPKDAARAQALRVKAADTTRELCVRAQDADSCFSLARMYEKGEGVDASAAQAIALYARACQAKHEVACGEEKRLLALPPP